MTDNKSINEWLAYQGLQWKEGEERIFKANFTWNEAQSIIDQLEAEGAVEYNGR